MKKAILISSIIISISFSYSLTAAPLGRLADHWYVGGSVGQSRLAPDTGDHWQISDDSGSAKKVYIGKDISKQLGLEVFWADLGEVELKNNNHSGRIHYNAIGANLSYNAPYSIVGLRPLGKLGIAKFDTQTKGDVKDEQENNLTLFAGIGVEYDLSRNISLRSEFEYFSKDISTFSIGLNWSSNYRDHAFRK